MDGIMPWTELESLIAPYYPKEGNGRPPVGLRIMLRIYFLQHWFNLSDPAAEEALYDSPALRRFAGVDLGRAAAPDETTILSSRHLLERHDLCRAMLDAVTHYLEDRGIRSGTRTIVDETIIHAPSSTKNATLDPDLEMDDLDEFGDPDEDEPWLENPVMGAEELLRFPRVRQLIQS
jgi:transposase, IS5 family